MPPGRKAFIGVVGALALLVAGVSGVAGVQVANAFKGAPTSVSTTTDESTELESTWPSESADEESARDEPAEAEGNDEAESGSVDDAQDSSTPTGDCLESADLAMVTKGMSLHDAKAALAGMNVEWVDGYSEGVVLGYPASCDATRAMTVIVENEKVTEVEDVGEKLSESCTTIATMDAITDGMTTKEVSAELGGTTYFSKDAESWMPEPCNPEWLMVISFTDGEVSDVTNGRYTG